MPKSLRPKANVLRPVIQEPSIPNRTLAQRQHEWGKPNDPCRACWLTEQLCAGGGTADKTSQWNCLKQRVVQSHVSACQASSSGAVCCESAASSSAASQPQQSLIKFLSMKRQTLSKYHMGVLNNICSWLWLVGSWKWGLGWMEAVLRLL